MKVILDPISRPETGRLIVQDDPFLIGRQQPPFAELQLPFVARLSRRHARLFKEQGSVYLIDLGSLNGTTLNGQSIRGKLVRLNPADRICFAGEWTFKVIIQNGAARQSRPVAVHLKLVPQHDGAPADTIYIDHFPFLINETTAFPPTGDSATELDGTRYIPYAHALILCRNGQLYLEDLGNGGGTFVSGSRLENKTVALKPGDLISFGRHPTVYAVRIQVSQEPFDGDQTLPTMDSGDTWTNRLDAYHKAAQNGAITLVSNSLPVAPVTVSHDVSGRVTQPDFEQQAPKRAAGTGPSSGALAPAPAQAARSRTALVLTAGILLLLLAALALYELL